MKNPLAFAHEGFFAALRMTQGLIPRSVPPCHSEPPDGGEESLLKNVYGHEPNANCPTVSCYFTA